MQSTFIMNLCLEDIDQFSVCINAIDEVPKGCQLIERQLKMEMEIGGTETSATLFKLKIGASVMHAVNGN